jgi:hypothetical protein
MTTQWQHELGRRIAISVIRQSLNDVGAGLEGSAVSLLMCARSIGREENVPPEAILASVLHHAQQLLDAHATPDEIEFVVVALRDKATEPS